jgi:membrane complex biogenesis BtpA family protein
LGTTVDKDFWQRKPIIGMIHLAALPGAPRADLPLAEVEARALADAEALVAGGCHALMLENFGDSPFFPGRVPPVVVAAMTRLAVAVKTRWRDVPLGINVLRNDGSASLAVAVAADAAFIRVNVLTGARVTDQGVVTGIAHELLRERAALGAARVRILADVDVKHSAPLAERPLADEVHDLIGRGMADAVVVSGAGTGKPVDLERLKAVKAAAGATPVVIGSGAGVATLPTLWSACDGFVVGTSLKRDGVSTAPVEASRVKELLACHAQSFKAKASKP